jgi:hypothetical protein
VAYADLLAFDPTHFRSTNYFINAFDVAKLQRDVPFIPRISGCGGGACDRSLGSRSGGGQKKM